MRKKFRYRFFGMMLTAVFFLYSSWIKGQTYDYINYTTKDGLPTNYVYGVMEDDQGYIWAYTAKGMAKFDGYYFKNYTTREGLPGNDVVKAVKDKVGKILLWTFKNQPAFIDKDSIFIIHDEPCEILNWNYDGSIYYVCNSGYYAYQNAKWQSLKFRKIDSIILQTIPEQLEFLEVLSSSSLNEKHQRIRQGQVYIEINDSLYFFSLKNSLVHIPLTNGYLCFDFGSQYFFWKKNGQFKQIRHTGVALPSTLQQTQIIQLGREERYIIRGGIDRFLWLDVNSGRTKLLELNKVGIDPGVANTVTILDSTFFVNSDDGIIEYGFDGNFIDQLALEELLEKYYLQRAYRDSKGNLWVGTREGGLFLIPRQKTRVRKLTLPYENDINFERLLTTEKGRLLGITDNMGIYLIENGIIKNIQPPQRDNRLISANFTPFGLLASGSKEGVNIIDKDNTVLVEPFSKGKAMSHEKGNNITDSQSAEDLFLTMRNTKTFAFSEMDSSLYLFRKSVAYRYRFENPESIYVKELGYNVNIAYYHSWRQQLYFGDHSGLFVLKNERPEKFLDNHEELEDITSLFGTKNTLWIGTESNGLFHYDFSKEELNKLSDATYVRHIKLTANREVLIASDEGVLVFDDPLVPKQPKTHFTVKNGLPTNSIRDVHLSKDGNYFYLATDVGLFRIDGDMKLQTPLLPDDLSITEFSVNQNAIRVSERLDLEYDQNNFQINYHLHSYASDGQIKYYTRLEPVQQSWQETAERKVNYFALNPGKYAFYLKAQDVYGREVEMRPLVFRIKKAWWQTIGFRVGAGLSGFGLLVFFILKRDKNRREELVKEKNINQRMAELELSALRAQMNPHFVFNALGAIQYYIQTNEEQAADEYLTKFARLMRKYLDSSKEKMIPLKEELELLSIYTDLEKLRFEDLFTTKIVVQEEVQTDDEFVPSMLIQPFIENAINHGLDGRRDKKGVLVVQFRKEKDVLVCEIKDNGIGRSNAQNNRRKGHKSRGMTIIKEKVETLKNSGIADVSIATKDLEPSDEQYPGTHVTIRIKNFEDESH